MMFTVWYSKGSQSTNLVSGSSEPQFANGVPCELDNVCVDTINADSWGEALEEYNRRIESGKFEAKS